MSVVRPKLRTVTTEELHAAPAAVIRAIDGPLPIILTRDGRVRAYIFRDPTPLGDTPVNEGQRKTVPENRRRR